MLNFFIVSLLLVFTTAMDRVDKLDEVRDRIRFPPSPVLHNCLTKEEWTPAKKAWCCKIENKGCDDQSGGTMCCQAMTARCLACSNNISVKEMCERQPELQGCEPKQGMCCKAMTAKCLACSNKISVKEMCKRQPELPGCPKQEISCTAKDWTCPPDYTCMIPRGGSEEKCVGRADQIEDPIAVIKLPTTPRAKCFDKAYKCPRGSQCKRKGENKGLCKRRSDGKFVQPQRKQRVCCRAHNAKCVACSRGVSEEEICKRQPKLAGCKPRRAKN